MDPDILKHALTEEERSHFEEKGYLIVENALSVEEVDHLTSAIDRLYTEALDSGKAKPGDQWGSSDYIWKDDAFFNLVTCPTTFPKIWGILGWNIFLYHAHMHIKPPAPDTEPTEGWMEWHQDSGRVNLEVRTFPAPRLSLKIGYFLTDISETGRGNFMIIPGSHISKEVPEFSEVGRDPRERTADRIPDEGMPVTVKPGTAVFFDRRLWHGRTANHSDLTRKVLFYGYGYRWIRPKDEMQVEQLHDRCTPIQKQLLGFAARNNGRYTPTDEDVPLRTWLIEQLGEEAVAAMDDPLQVV